MSATVAALSVRRAIAARPSIGATGWVTTAAMEKGLTPAELAALQSLQAEHDHARTGQERELVAERIYDLIGHRIREMFTRTAMGRRLSPDQVESLAWQALMQALSLSGVSRLTRSSAPHNDWAAIIQACRPPSASAAGRKIWGMLSPQFQDAVSKLPPLQASNRTLDESFVKELNAILRRPDFYDPTAWAGIALPQEARELLARVGVP